MAREVQDGAVRHLLQACSDHSPLLISTGGFPQTGMTSKPFRFQVAWATHNQFEDVVRASWCSPFPLMPKLLELAAALTMWNKEVFGNLFRRKRKLWARLAGIQRRIMVGTLRYILKLERRLRQELEQMLDQIAMLWFQKAREDQIRGGDRNTKYFHMSTIIRRRFNRVNVIKDNDGVWCTDPRCIHQLIVAHFRALFFAELDANVEFRTRTVDFPRLSSLVAQGLQQLFTRDDITLALKSIQLLKAPDPDGFHAYFF